MAWMWRITLSVLVSIAACTTNASAFGGHVTRWPSSAFSSSLSYYYMAPPVYYYYCPLAPSGPTIVPVPDARPSNAAPKPAPPSTKEPPLGSGDSRMPKITTSRSSVANEESTKGTCRVGFWNLAGKDVTLTVEGKALSLPRNQVVTFDIERSFTWQVAGQAQNIERVPEGQARFEVVVRD